MIVKFKPKFGKTVLKLKLPDGSTVEATLHSKYGKNKIVFPTTDRAGTEFNLKYGTNYIDVPVTKHTKQLRTGKRELTSLWNARVTLYIDVPETDTMPRTIERRVINQCRIYGHLTDKPKESVRDILNAKTVVTKDTDRYIKPHEYMSLPPDVRTNYYTVTPGDFIVFDEVEDIVSDALEFAKLQQKYKDVGIKVTVENVNINGMAVDNIMISNV